MELCTLAKNACVMTRFSFIENCDALSLIEVLAEFFNFCVPDVETLKAEASGDFNLYKQIIHSKHAEVKTAE